MNKTKGLYESPREKRRRLYRDTAIFLGGGLAAAIVCEALEGKTVKIEGLEKEMRFSQAFYFKPFCYP